jgi:tetratricopeptide (TPR) repeat protein
MRKRILIILSFILFGTCTSHAQQKAEEYLRQQEQLKRMRLMSELDSGVYFMDIGEHEMADEKFKYVLANIRAVPSELAYYFGKNSYFLKQYKQSIDWLNKYIQLKGMNGQYSKDAVAWQKKSEIELMVARQQEAEKTDQVLSKNYEIDCGPTGKVICPVCRGDHVIIKKGAFGDDYRTCPYCNEHGILSCEEYNLLVKGELAPKF